MKNLILIIIFGIISLHSVNAQSLERSVFSSQGNSFTNTNFSLDWSLGETIVSTAIATGIVLTQGFQQPSTANISVKKVNKELNISVFPNPVMDKLTLQWDNKSEHCMIQILDVKGTVISQCRWMDEDDFSMDWKNYAQGMYFVQLTVNSESKTIKILKL